MGVGTNDRWSLQTRRPIHFDLPPAIKTGNAIPGLSARIGERSKDHGSLIIRALGLEVQKVFIDNRLQFGLFPLRGRFLSSTGALLPPADITPETVRLHTRLRVRDLGAIHVSGTSRLQTGDGFMPKGLDERVGGRHRVSRSEILRTTTGGCPYITVIVGDGPRAVPTCPS